MVTSERLICKSDDLLNGGEGVRFKLPMYGREEAAFAIRYEGQVYAYLNLCAHVPVELDWPIGTFFDFSKLYLMCANHGALYSPVDGRCLGGRCNGKGLKPLTVSERDGAVYLTLTE